MSATTEQNLAVIQNAFQNFLTGNIPGIIDICTHDITWDAYHHPAVPYAKKYTGKAGAGEFFTTLGAAVDYEVFDPREFFVQDDSVLVRGYHQATVKATGKKYGHDFLMHFRLRDGMVYYYFAFIDIADQAQAFQS